MGESSDLPTLANGGHLPASNAMSPEAVLAQIRGLSAEDRARLEIAYATLRRDVEARARASEESLRQSEERFAKAFAASPDGLVISRLHDGTIREINTSFLRIFGLQRDEAIGRRSTDLELFADPAERARALALLRAEGHVRNLELLIRRRSGELRTVLLSIEAIAVDDEPLLLTIVRDVTEAQRAAEAVRASEALLAAFLEHSPSSLFIKDAAGRYIVVNRAFLAATGKAVHEVLEKTDHELYPPELAEVFVAEDQEVRASGASRRYEESFAHDGQPYTFLSHKFPLPGGQIGCVSTDITERKAAEEALRHSEQAFRALYESMRDAFVSVDINGTIRQHNRSFQELLGYSDAELAQLSYRDITPPQWHALEERIVQEEVLTQGFSGVYEKEYRRKDGTIVPIELRTVLITNPQGQSPQMWAIVRDITERKRVEHTALRRSAQLQRLAEAATRIHATRDVMAVARLVTEEARALIGAHYAATRMTAAGADPVIRSVSCSEQYTHSYGDAEESDASQLDALVCRTNRPLRLTQTALEAHPAWGGLSAETGAPRPRGWLAAPLVGRGGRNLGLIRLSDPAEDAFSPDDEAILVQLAQLTAIAIENQQLLAEEQRARAAAEAALRLREQFLSIASHELRTPLASVLGYAQHFQRRAARAGTLSEQDQRSLQQIITHAERLNRMLATILDVSRIDQGRLQLERAPLNLTALVHETVTAIAGTVLHQLIVTGTEQPCWVDGDALRLEQVLQNLLGNAIKYSPGGGTVTVTITSDREQVLVQVQDAGIGIPAADLPHIFERFYRAGNVSADNISGVGIGLFVVQEIVALHGGTITVASEEGEGSTFTLTLPLVAAP